MNRGRIKKVVGTISNDIVEKYKLYEYKNKPIIQSLDLYAHIHKHIKEFKSIDRFNKSIFNVDKIIKNPYFVYYEEKRNSLHYFGLIEEYVCVIVKISLKKNKDTYISTIYPISKNKIEKLINNSENKNNMI